MVNQFLYKSNGLACHVPVGDVRLGDRLVLPATL
jgi:hypothetical protein